MTTFLDLSVRRGNSLVIDNAHRHPLGNRHGACRAQRQRQDNAARIDLGTLGRARKLHDWPQHQRRRTHRSRLEARRLLPALPRHSQRASHCASKHRVRQGLLEVPGRRRQTRFAPGHQGVPRPTRSQVLAGNGPARRHSHGHGNRSETVASRRAHERARPHQRGRRHEGHALVRARRTLHRHVHPQPCERRPVLRPRCLHRSRQDRVPRPSTKPSRLLRHPLSRAL